MEFLYEDCKSLLEQVNLQDKELRNKRRWLIGLSASRSELKGSKFQTERPIPEYMLREDDVSYETIKSFVEELVNSKKRTSILQDEMQLIHSPRDIIGLFSLINDMTNQGLLSFAEKLTGGSVKFEKTRGKMKQIIKGSLSQEFSKKTLIQQMSLFENYSALLKNPYNFHWRMESRFIPDNYSCHIAAHKILDILEELPMQTLSAMNRKLRGIKGYIPKLIPKNCGWQRDKLIKSLRKKCFKLLSKVSEGDSLQEPLAKAMEVAALTLKLTQGCQYVTNFKRFSPEINILQNEIATCIHLVDQRMKFAVLKEIKILLEPKAKLSERILRTSLRNLLTEYLFEISDMDTIPQCLLEALAIIMKKGLDKSFSKIKIDEEVECILSLSASLKQVLWDFLNSENELDLDFKDAYMEDLEESDGDDIFEQKEDVKNNISDSRNSDKEGIGSTWEMEPVENFEISSTKSYSEIPNSKQMDELRYHLVSLRNMETDSVADMGKKDPNLVSCGERRLIFGDESRCKNGYLDVQGASDETSMVAYRLIGCMLYDFAQIEDCELKQHDVSYLGVGNLKEKENRGVRKESTTNDKDDCSILIKRVEELIPSFGKSEADRLKEVMGSIVD